MKKRILGIIGGSGLYNIDGLKNVKWKKISSSWGDPSDRLLSATLNKEEVYFLPRHARGHKINPSNINFRANIEILKKVGVTDIVSVSAVGSLQEHLVPGCFVIVDQFIDRTFARVKTFFDKEIVAHVSMAKPTSPGLMKCCESALIKSNIPHQVGGTYLVMEGPQFSSLAESKMYRSWKADVIGMTNMPEAKLAREAEIRYCTVAMVTDFDCWHPDHDEVDVPTVIKTLQQNAANAQNMIFEIIKTFKSFNVKNDPATDCLDAAIITQPKFQTKSTIKKLRFIAGRVLKKK
jgi:5'-methylthioadenosine phosphorylase